MKISSRLVLAMVLLVVVTSCMVGAFAYHFVAEAPPRAALMSIISAALAGGGIAAVLASALAVGITNVLLKPPPSVPEPAMACEGTEQARAYQALADRERMAQAIIESALDAFVQTDEHCVILNWSPHAEALMGWTRAEAVGRSVEQLVFPEAQRPVHRQWVDRFLSKASGDATGGRYETPLLHKDGCEFFAEVSLTALRRNDGYIINAFVRDITAKRAAEE
jgi:PAS domain S-box-containing protein